LLCSAKWYTRQMAQAPNGTGAKWYTRQMAQAPNDTQADYYSIWFNFRATFFISEKKTGVIKLKTHFNYLVPCHEMLIMILNCWYIRNIIKYFLNNNIKKLSRSIIFMSTDFYSLKMDSSNYLTLFTLNGLARSHCFAKVWKVWNGTWPSISGLRKTYLTILKRAWSADSKMVR
jgi:hypothetical protein